MSATSVGPQPQAGIALDDRVRQQAGWRHRADIVGLRGVAVLMVVLYHLELPFTDGGFAGVDVFFTLSGFLIAGILLEEARRTGRISLVDFWARRARRLLPAASAMIVGSLLLSMALASPLLLGQFARSAIAATAMVSNVVFGARRTDYFAVTSPADPLLHTWSLGVEEQFYLVFAPLVAAAAWWATRPRGRAVPTTTLLGAATVSVAGFALAIIMARYVPLRAFYWLPARAWELAVGVALAAALASGLGGGSTTRLRKWCAVGGFAGVLLSLVVVRAGTGVSVAWLLLPVASTAALLFGGIEPGPGLIVRLLSFGPLQAIGRWSYSWYLWHWPFLIATTFIDPHPPLVWRVGAVLLALAIAAASFRFLESPIRGSSWLAGRPRTTLAAALAVTVLVVGMARMARAWAIRGLEREPERTLALQRVELPAIYAAGCHADVGVEPLATRPCVFGDPGGRQTVVLFGDSHAAHWFPALETIARQHSWRLHSLTRSSCPSVQVSIARSDGSAYPQCDQWRAAAIARIIAERPALVVVSNRAGYAILDHARLRPSEADGAAIWRAGIGALIASLAPSGARIVLLADPPSPGVDIPACLSAPRRTQNGCDWEDPVQVRDARYTLESLPDGSTTGYERIDLTSEICPRSVCRAERSYGAAWRDEHHISVRAALALRESLERALVR